MIAGPDPFSEKHRSHWSKGLFLQARYAALEDCDALYDFCQQPSQMTRYP